MIAYFALLCFGILTLAVHDRWAWSLFQVGMFALAGWRGVRPTRLAIPLAAAAVWPILQVALGTTVSRGVTLDAALDWLTFLVVFALGCERRQDFLHAAVWFGVAIAIVSTAQQYTSAGKIFWIFPSGFSDEVLGPFVNRNQYAAWIELLLPIALYRRMGLAATVLLLSVAASASRAGFALAALETVVVLAILSKRTRVVIPSAIAVAVLGWLALHTRFGEPETLRIDAARASLHMILDRPWTGFGLGTWPVIYPRYASYDAGIFVNQAHNDWLQWASEGGVPFLLFMAAFAAGLWKRANASVFGLGIIAFLLHSLVDYPMQQRPALAAWFFAMAAAAASHSPERKPGPPRLGRAAVRDCLAEEDGPRVLLE